MGIINLALIATGSYLTIGAIIGAVLGAAASEQSFVEFHRMAHEVRPDLVRPLGTYRDGAERERILNVWRKGIAVVFMFVWLPMIVFRQIDLEIEIKPKFRWVVGGRKVIRINLTKPNSNE